MKFHFCFCKMKIPVIVYCWYVSIIFALLNISLVDYFWQDTGGSAPNQTGGVFEDSDDDILIQATNDNIGDALDDDDDIPSLKHLDDDSRGEYDCWSCYIV